MHITQAEAPGLDENFPFAHDLHAIAPVVGENMPGGHTTHAPFAVASEKNPGGQDTTAFLLQAEMPLVQHTVAQWSSPYDRGRVTDVVESSMGVSQVDGVQAATGMIEVGNTYGK